METTGRYKFLLKVIVVLENILLLNGTYFMLLSFFPVIDIESNDYQLLLLFINLSYLLSLNFFKVTIDARKWKWSNIIKRAFYRVGFAMLITIVFLFTLKTSDHISRLFIMTYFPLLFLLIIFFHWITREMMGHLLKTDNNRDNAVILGAGTLGQKLHHELMSDHYLGINSLGFFDDNPMANDGNLLGNIEDVKKFVQGNKVAKIYCTLPLSAKDKIKDILNFAERNVVNFHIIPSTQHYIDTPIVLDTIGNIPILSIRKIPLSFSHNASLKRALDVLASSLFLAIVFPFVYLFIGLAIKISSPGPVFFTQMRTGKGGKDFKCYKFRSMRCNKDCDTKQATANDARKTRIGNFLRRSNLDELPQFINVFKGDMSIVGPRPHMLFHTDQYSDIVHQYMVRHFIRPGITGLAQVSGYRGETKEVSLMEKRVKTDIYYLENWTLLLDIEIAFRTLGMFFIKDKNAY